MQTILLATCEKNILHPLTEYIAGPMLPVLNRPVMSYQVQMLAQQGFSEVLVSLYEKADQIERYFANGERWRLKIDYLLQPEPFGTAGSLKWAENSLTSTFLCLPADMLIGINISQALAEHKASGCLATAVINRSEKRGLQCFHIDRDNQILGLGTSRPVGENWSATGVYFFELDALNYIPRWKKFDIYSQLIPALLIAGCGVGALDCAGSCTTIDSFRSYAALQKAYLREIYFNPKSEPLVAPDSKGMALSTGVWVGRSSNIHRTASIHPPVMIGENSYIGPNAKIGPDAVIGSNVVIDTGATVAHSVVLDHSYIGVSLKIDHYVVSRDLLIDYSSETSVVVNDGIFLQNTMMTRNTRKISRLLDIVAAFFLMLLFLPVAILVMLYLLLLGGPVFARAPYLAQQAPRSSTPAPYRVRVFPLTRFHTGKPASKWLQRLDLHRIPELWNVMKGDMRLVGLSLQPAEAAYKISETWQHLRQNGLPGFTGIWYLHPGVNEENDDWMIADAVYLARRSFWQDLGIVLQTPFAWFKKVFLGNRQRYSGVGSMKMEARSETGIYVLKITGSFRGKDAAGVREWLNTTIHSDCPNIIVNLEEVPSIDSRAMSTLLFGLKESRKAGGNLLLCGLQQELRILFEMTRLSQIFTILSREQDALLEFGKQYHARAI